MQLLILHLSRRILRNHIYMSNFKSTGIQARLFTKHVDDSLIINFFCNKDCNFVIHRIEITTITPDLYETFQTTSNIEITIRIEFGNITGMEFTLVFIALFQIIQTFRITLKTLGR